MTNAREAPRLSHLPRFNAGPRALMIDTPRRTRDALSPGLGFTVLCSCRTERSTHIYTHHSPLPTPTNGIGSLEKPLSARVSVAMLACDDDMRARAI